MKDSELTFTQIIEMIRISYKFHKLVVYEDEMGYRRKSYYDVVISHYIVNHINMVIDFFDDIERLILVKEIIEGKRGNWYLEYLSATSYYRHRKIAYTQFLRCLDD